MLIVNHIEAVFVFKRIFKEKNLIEIYNLHFYTHVNVFGICGCRVGGPQEPANLQFPPPLPLLSGHSENT